MDFEDFEMVGIITLFILAPVFIVSVICFTIYKISLLFIAKC